MKRMRLYQFVLALLCALPAFGAETRTAAADGPDLGNVVPASVDCTASISAGRLNVPCVRVGDQYYQADLSLATSAGGLGFSIASATPRSLSYVPACLAYFMGNTGRIYLPCVDYQGSQYRAYLDMSTYPSFQLSAAWLANRGSTDQQDLHDYNALVSAIVQANQDFAVAASQLEASSFTSLGATQSRALLQEYINAGEVLGELMTKLGDLETGFAIRQLFRSAPATRGSFDWLLGFLPDTSGVSADLAKKVGDNIAGASATMADLDRKLAAGQIDNVEYAQVAQQGFLSGFGSAIRFGILAVAGTGAALIVGGAIAAAGGTAGVVIGAGVLTSAAVGTTLDWLTAGCSGSQCNISTGRSLPGTNVPVLPVSGGALVVTSEGNIPVTMAVTTTANQQAFIDFAPTAIDNYVAGGKQSIVVSDTPIDSGSVDTPLDLSGNWAGSSTVTVSYSTTFNGQTLSSDSSTQQQSMTLTISQSGDTVTLSVPGQLGADSRTIDATVTASGFSYSGDLFTASTRPEGVTEEHFDVSGAYANGVLTLTTTIGYTQSYSGVVSTTSAVDVGTLTRAQ